MASKLTEEQLKKIEENRRKALLKRQQKAVLQSTAPSKPTPSSNPSPSPSSVIQLQQKTSNERSSKPPSSNLVSNNQSTYHEGKSELVLSTSSASRKRPFTESSHVVMSDVHSNDKKQDHSDAQAINVGVNDNKRKQTISVKLATPSNSEGTNSARNIPSSNEHSFSNDNFRTFDSSKDKYASSSPSTAPPVISNSNLTSTSESTNAIDYDRIEQNRLKALAKRAEKLSKSPQKGSAVPMLSGHINSAFSSGASTANKASVSSLNNKTETSKPESSFYSGAPSSVLNNPGAIIAQALPQNDQWNLFGGAGQSKVKGHCILICRERFMVKSSYCAPLIELYKMMETKLYDAVSKKWSLHLSEYIKFMAAIKSMGPGMDIEPLPKAIIQAFGPIIKGQNPARNIPMADLSRVEQSLVNSLMPFQREGVNFGVYKNGRVLIADDMGLGKTIQAICLACYYRDEWPLLVVVPSSVRFDWAQNIKRWVPSLDPQTIHVAVTSKDSCTTGLVNILSYDLMAKKGEVLKNHKFQVVIMDECHLLKNFKTARCKAALPVIKNARRVILLSGTPALSRPSELFTQIDAVCPFLFKYHDFGVRYCDGKQTHFGWDFSGSSNMEELQIFLQEKIMIRRLKKDVLQELPDKIRQMILLDPSSIKIDKSLKNASKIMTSANLKKTEERGALLDFFHKSGTAKLKAIRSYVEDLLEEEKKFLIFAHHGDVLDGIEEIVKDKIGVNYIRIDGRTGSEMRNTLCHRFQHKDSVRVAILSITACNAGLNLSSASLVIFSELFWNPGILVQAEDRVHRIGQQDMVVVQYLVAKGTSDDHIWPMIQKKLDVLSKAGLTKDNFSTAQTTQQLDPRQEEITRFLEESFSDDFADCLQATPPKSSPEEQDDDGISGITSKTPSKVAKQQSILKYTSPIKDLPSSSHSIASPPKPKKPAGLLKFFSPDKPTSTTSSENNNNVKRQSLFTTVDSKNRLSQNQISAICKSEASEINAKDCNMLHKADENENLEDLFDDDEDEDELLMDAASMSDKLTVKKLIPQPAKRRKIEPFQPPYRHT